MDPLSRKVHASSYTQNCDCNFRESVVVLQLILSTVLRIPLGRSPFSQTDDKKTDDLNWIALLLPHSSPNPQG